MVTNDVTEGGMPGYSGLVKNETIGFGQITLQIETWPDYRIGASHWPSGRLLAKALAESAFPGLLPEIEGRTVLELGAGPGLPSMVCGKLGAASVVLTDLVELLPLMNRNLELNGLLNTCRVDVLDWDGAAASPHSVASRHRSGDAALDILLAADVVYIEEQEPLIEALVALMKPGHTQLVLAYKNRNPGDRRYLQERILPRLDGVRFAEFSTPEDGRTELYVGHLRHL
eukprot:CAMPEP_0172820286 /NCGR_PEP_ID=MMETSP1075-20121228/15160_1 /TAXON_ID=2916 /ORGANISM="Ceratium fusus, Strain PA161109" /LENGTH=228 /DNA_ID=CAMNT_0013660929 /DNA_START=139 /DNA_END=825 /DNA_ORIENTATION=+